MKRTAILLIFTILLLSCKKEAPITYKYSEKEDLFACSSVDMELIKEALYAFEDYVTNNHSFREPFTTAKGYANYWSVATTDRMPFINKLDDHTKAIFNALKDEQDLWVNNGNKVTLNYNGEFMSCLIDNVKNEEAKRVMSALVETKTFRSNIFTPALDRNTKQFLVDKSLAAYVALDLFYAKLFQIDFSKPYKAPPPPPENEHEGHNH
ncbi:MAG: hypothetical protein KJO41_04280 [Bacteroidia bacterium]|nr:hypothetical protein [Bacteroidia bacterium]MBT8278196.1 hypothetical protein [Bacteroidia bacterium]NND26398.1 hypothetical protein [Flavobacteriaceae bacterium]